MTSSLDASVQECRRIARRTGRNFYWSFLTLPPPLRRDMCVLYAFMRITDDIGDEGDDPPEERSRRLDWWREAVHAALGQGTSAVLSPGGEHQGPHHQRPADGARILPALQDLIERRRIPARYLDDVIAGVASDLTPTGFAEFADLERYCYHVAGAVGLCCIHVWGFQGAEAPQQAVDCGTAFQLTNILRDLGEDARRGRLYLPREDLDRWSIPPDELVRRGGTPEFKALMAFEVERARGFYRRGAELLTALELPGRRILAAMFRIYGGILDEIERRDYDVLSRRIELSGFRKLQAACIAWWRPRPPRAAWYHTLSGD